VVHLRIVAPRERADRVLEVLEGSDAVTNVIVLAGAARKPEGDVIFCDVAREDASVILSDLRALEIDRCGSIAMETIDAHMSDVATEAERAAVGAPSDAVIWEEVTARTSEDSTLSASFLAFMTLAMLIASVGIYLDSPILVVGAMVVGPEFGPIAGFCVAVVQRRAPLAIRSLTALLVGFPIAIAVTLVVSLIFKATGVTPEVFTDADHGLARSIANPDFLAFFVAFCAGIAGTISLTTAKSGALIGVLISVTTIPAAANVAVGLAYGDDDAWTGSLQQLGLNVGAILLAGVTTLYVQRLLYLRRRRHHRERLGRVGVATDETGGSGAATAAGAAPTPSSPATTTPRSSSAPGR
jgi:uncharacterized hydrophobic protein (TIGR00271 family)